jgi:hypothetical protein
MTGPLRVPTPDSSSRRRAAWLFSAWLAIAFGLLIAVGSLTQVTTPTEVLFSMFFIGPALLYVLVGLRVVLRVTGRDPDVPVRTLSTVAFGITAAIAATGALVSIGAWLLAGTVESSDPGPDPGLMLLLIVGCASVAAAALALARVSGRIDDRPGSASRPAN